jgi:hypothetical protein
VETDAEWNTWVGFLTDLRFETAVELRNRLRMLGPDVAFVWGFDPALLPRISQLHSAGLEPWWFRGDETAARESCLKRKGPASIEAYATQVQKIERAWPQIEKVYRDRVLDVVSPGPKYLAHDAIYDRVVEATI